MQQDLRPAILLASPAAPAETPPAALSPAPAAVGHAAAAAAAPAAVGHAAAAAAAVGPAVAPAVERYLRRG